MPYSCKVAGCDAKFRDLSSLKLHNLKHTGEKPYTCEFCEMKFKTSSDYLRHKRSHTNERRYECKLCSKKFIQGWHLKQHQRMHSDLRPWVCELCDKKFRSKASLVHHTKWHRGIKDYQCDVCHKKFSTKKYLESHQVIHTNDKPFTCKTCGSCFNQISNLKRHERIHSDVKQYKCQFCPKAFKYINSWRYHEGTHKGDLFTCEKCGLSFKSPQGIKVHTSQCEDTSRGENRASVDFQSFILHSSPDNAYASDDQHSEATLPFVTNKSSSAKCKKSAKTSTGHSFHQQLSKSISTIKLKSPTQNSGHTKSRKNTSPKRNCKKRQLPSKSKQGTCDREELDLRSNVECEVKSGVVITNNDTGESMIVKTDLDDQHDSVIEESNPAHHLLVGQRLLGVIPKVEDVTNVGSVNTNA